jgi:yersiniabactin nonribosomal peptide synthetase
LDLRALIAGVLESPLALLHDASGEPLTPDELRRAFAAMSAALSRPGGPRGPVGLRLARGPRSVLWALACMDAGRAFAPLGRDWPAARVSRALEVAGAVELVDDSRGGRLEAVPGARAAELPPGTLYVMFTSGSSGAPKGVLVGRAAFEAFLAAFEGRLARVGPDARALMVSELTFDMWLDDLALLLLRRCRVFVSRAGGDPFRLAEELSRLRITTVHAVPQAYALLLRAPVLSRADLSALDCARVSGSRLAPQLYRELRRCLPGAELQHGYGPTECTVYVMQRLLADDEGEDVADGAVTVGPPLAGTRARLAGPDGKELPGAGARGELWLAGPQLMSGYAGGPAAAASRFAERDGRRWYRTGDRAERDARGFYALRGRLDDALKRRGVLVSLSGLDACLQLLPGVRDSVTIAVPDPDTEHRLLSCVIAAPGAREDALMRALGEQLPADQLPDRLVLLDAFPLGETGKPDEAALARRFGSAP